MNQLQMLKRALIAYVNSAKVIWSAITHPLSIISKKATMLKDYRIYGNSVQDGEPTPDNPIEVQSVGELTTKNIFDIDGCLNECLTKNDDGTYTLKKMESNRFTNWATVYIPIDTKYAKGFDVVEKNRPSYSSDAIGVQYKYEDGTEGTGVLYANNLGTATGGYHVSTVPKNVVAVRFYMDWSEAVGDYITFKNVQFEFGEELTEYEPYHKYKVPVTVRGKNLLYSYRKSTQIGNTVTMDGSLMLLEGKCEETTNNLGLGYSDAESITLKAGKTYTLSVHYISGEAIYVPNAWYIGLRKSDGSWLSTLAGITHNNYKTTKKVTFTVEEDILVSFGCVGRGEFNELRIGIQLEEGSTATDYEPYIEPQTYNIYLDEPLRKIGDYADVVDFEKGVVVRNITETNLIKDGYTINAMHFKTRTNTSRSLIDVNNKKPNPTGGKSLFLCNRGQGTPDAYWNTDKVGICEIMNPSMSSIIFSLPIDEVAVQSDFDTWVLNNDTTLVYLSQTPTKEPISLPNLPQFKGTTVYEVQQDIPPSGIEVCYYE